MVSKQKKHRVHIHIVQVAPKPAQQKTQKVLNLIKALEDSNRKLLLVLHQDHVSFADDGIGAAPVVPEFCSFCLAAARDAV
jgi:hypothetical protein